MPKKKRRKRKFPKSFIEVDQTNSIEIKSNTVNLTKRSINMSKLKDKINQEVAPNTIEKENSVDFLSNKKFKSPKYKSVSLKQT